MDDGSTDNTYQVASDFKEKSNIILLCEENAGPSATRYLGLKVASGEFVGVVDSDDYVLPQMFERLYLVAKGTGADIVNCGVYAFDENEFVDNLSVGGSQSSSSILSWDDIQNNSHCKP